MFALGTEHLLFLTEATEGFRVLMRNSYAALEHGAIQNDVMSPLRDGESENRAWVKINTSLENISII